MTSSPLSLHTQIGSGISGFQVREYNQSGALAFYVARKDGTFEDFSYLKVSRAYLMLMGTDQIFQYFYR